MSKVLWKALLASPAVLGASLLVSTSAIAAEAEATGSVAAFSEAKNASALSAPVAAKAEDSKTLLALEPKPSQPATSIPVSQLEPSTQDQLPAADNSLAQVTSVSELSDVQPTDWAFQAVQSLVERYGCIEGYPDRTFRGNRAATRYELAAALNACLNQISAQLGGLTAEDLATIKRLQDEFAAELATLRGRVDALEARTDELEANQFSTTTKLSGEVIFAPFGTTGDFADANPDTDISSNIAFGYRARLNFDTSFTGEDRLRVRLQARDVENLTDVTGTAMSRLGFDGDSDDLFEIDDLYYRVPLGERATLNIAATETDYNDVVDVGNPLLASSGSGSISRFGRFNPIFRQGDGSAGAVLNYDFTDNVTFNIGYFADSDDAATALATEGGGLFGGQYAALAQLNFEVGEVFALGLTYLRSFFPAGEDDFSGDTGSAFANDPFGGIAISANTYGVQATVTPSTFFNISAWAGYAQASAEGGAGVNGDADANILNYAVSLNFPDLGREGNLGAVIFGMPPKVIDNDIEAFEDPDTSYHLEGLYRFRVTENIAVTPGAFVIFNPEHNSDNGNVYVGTVRTTFSF